MLTFFSFLSHNWFKLIHSNVFFTRPGKLVRLSLLVVWLLLSLLPYLDAQVTCGTYTAPPPSTNNPDSLVYDRFGNVFNIADLQVPATVAGAVGSEGCNLGYFNLVFDTDVSQNMRNVTREVFCYLSTLIAQRQNTNVCEEKWPQSSVNIQVVMEDLASNVGATGSPFYFSAPLFYASGMVVDRPFQKINGGTVPGTAPIFDGAIQINSAVNNFNLNYPNPTPQGQIDFYSVILHEALHVLGFASRIGIGTISQSPITLWDHALFTVGEFPNGPATQLYEQSLSNNCTENAWKLTPPLPFPLSNCQEGELDIVVGENIIAPVLGGQGVALSGNELANAMSHLNPTCGGIDYVMSPVLNPGQERRIVSNPELDILCALGYQLAGGSCSGCYNIAHSEHPYQYNGECCSAQYIFCADEDVNHEIAKSDLLCNDFGDGDRDITLATINNSVLQINDESILLPNTLTPGNYQLRYLIADPDCNCLFSEARVTIVILQCPQCSTSLDACSNLLCVNNFEEFNEANSGGTTLPAVVFDGYQEFGSPDIFSENGNEFLFLGNDQLSQNATTRESVTYELSECIPPQCSLHLNMDLGASLSVGSVPQLYVWGSTTYPCSDVPINNTPNTDNFCGDGSIFHPFGILPAIVPNPASVIPNPGTYIFSPAELIWQNQTNENICFITLVPGQEYPVYSFHIDNISARLTCTPTITCNYTGTTEICNQGETTLSWEICAEEVPGNTNTVVTVNINLPPGVTAIDPTQLQQTVTLSEGDCATISIAVTTTLSAGTMLDVSLTGDGTGTCSNSSIECAGMVTVTNCNGVTLTCPCQGEKTINIIADNNDGSLYSDLENEFNYDQNNDGVIGDFEHSGCIAIWGKLIIDVPLTITGANIQMQPGAEIIIRKPAASTIYPTLNLEINHIYGCVQMWKGITVENNCRLEMTEGSIRDAETAVRVPGATDGLLTPAASLFIEDMLFARNHIGIHLGREVKSFVTHNPFVNLTFLGRENNMSLLPPFTANLANYSSYQGYAGIVAQACPSLNVGNANAPNFTVIFDRLNNGIISESTPLNVHNSQFSDIRGSFIWPETNVTPPSFASSAGMAIVAAGRTAVLRNNQFTGCAYATFGSVNQNINFSNNRVINCAKGIILRSPQGFRILDNPEMKVGNRAIAVYNPVGDKDFHIARNKGISIGTFPGLATCIGCSTPLVFINGATPLNIPVNKGRISDNVITGNNYGFTGIEINQIGGWTIDINTVQNCGANGLNLNNSSGNYLYGNTITNVGSTCFNVVGSMKNTFCCNYASNANRGFQFTGTCDNTSLRNNDLANFSENALRCNGGTQIGLQYDKGNIFSISANKGAHFGGFFDIQSSQFRVFDDIIPERPVSIFAPNQNPDDPWFVFEGSKPTCGDNECQALPPVAPLDGRVTSLDRVISDGTYANEPYGDRIQWEGELVLFRKLMEDDETLSEDPQMNTFFKAREGSNLEKFARAGAAVQDMADGDDNISQQLSTLNDVINADYTQIMSLSWALRTASGNEAASIKNQLAGLHLLTQTRLDQMEQLLQTAETDYSVKYTIAEQALNNLSSEAPLAGQNLKVITEIYMQTIARGNQDYSPEQWSLIQNMANQCHLEGGRAVLIARALYLMREHAKFDDVDICSTPPVGHRSESVTATPVPLVQGITIVPNPAQDRIWIWDAENKAVSQRSVGIYDVNGTLLQRTESPDTKIAIATDQLPNGIYFCRVERNDGTAAVQRFVIIR